MKGNAIIRDDVDLVKKFFSADNVNKRMENGMYPLEHAIRYYSCDAIEKILLLGADVDPEDLQRSYISNTRNPRVISLLLKFGANVNRRDEKGKTPLMRFVDRDVPAIIKILLDAGTDVAATDHVGNTALMYAVMGGNKKHFKALVDKGASFETVNNEGFTPLSFVEHYGQHKIKRAIVAIM